MSRVAAADPLWKMQSTDSLSVPGEARKGRLSVTQWAHNSLLTCTRGPASWADLAVRVDRGRDLFIPPLVRAASQPA